MRIGLNYKSLTKVDEDIALFRKIGISNIRPHVPTPSVLPTWSEDAYKEWRDVAKRFTDAGFYVVWGLSWSRVSISSWEAYKTLLLQEAAYCRTHNVCAEFTIGNEFETHIVDGTAAADIRSAIRGLATDVKAVFQGPVVYAVEGSQPADNHGSSRWAYEGKGDLDRISLNTYGAWIPDLPRYSTGYILHIPPMAAKFAPNEWYVSEFNVDGGPTFSQMPEIAKTVEIYVMLQYFQSQRIPLAYFFQYRGFTDSDVSTQFQARYSDGAWRDSWWPVLAAHVE